MNAHPHDRSSIVARLRAAGCVFAEDEANLLLTEATDASALERLVERRVAGEPLEHIVGWVDFGGLRVLLDPGVFVPRQRTLALVDLATELLRGAAGPERPGSVVVDLCCGSGAIGAVLLSRFPGIELHAADVDPAAVDCARSNLAEHPTATVHQGDLMDALPAGLRGRIAVLAANTPYVPHGAIASMPPEARDHEALIALDGGEDGLDVQRRLAADVCEWLAPGGHVLVETSEDQAAIAGASFASFGLMIRVHNDVQRGGTVVIATKPPH